MFGCILATVSSSWTHGFTHGFTHPSILRGTLDSTLHQILAEFEQYCKQSKWMDQTNAPNKRGGKNRVCLVAFATDHNAEYDQTNAPLFINTIIKFKYL